MNEERQLAQEKGIESPVWDDISGTHKCYDESVEHVVQEMDEQDLLFVASHNKESCQLAMDIVEERDMKDFERVRFA